mmetsp:Transcript_12426/g.30538  ORF Transcript_12426/g.30538 Transcript_12426/m.30538 type:complete len:302 (-) Transcript_12426:421-1326(-)
MSSGVSRVLGAARKCAACRTWRSSRYSGRIMVSSAPAITHASTIFRPRSTWRALDAQQHSGRSSSWLNSCTLMKPSTCLKAHLMRMRGTHASLSACSPACSAPTSSAHGCMAAARAASAASCSGVLAGGGAEPLACESPDASGAPPPLPPAAAFNPCLPPGCTPATAAAGGAEGSGLGAAAAAAGSLTCSSSSSSSPRVNLASSTGSSLMASAVRMNALLLPSPPAAAAAGSSPSSTGFTSPGAADAGPPAAPGCWLLLVLPGSASRSVELRGEKGAATGACMQLGSSCVMCFFTPSRTHL